MVAHPKLSSKLLQDKVFPGGWRKIIKQRLSSNAQDRAVISPNGKRLRSTKKLLTFLQTHVEYAKTFDPFEIHMEQNLGRLTKPNRQTQEVIDFVNAQKIDVAAKITNLVKEENFNVNVSDVQDHSMVIKEITSSPHLSSQPPSQLESLLSQSPPQIKVTYKNKTGSNIDKKDKELASMNKMPSIASEQNKESFEAATKFQSFRELVHDLERYFLSSNSVPSVEELMNLSKKYGVGHEMISGYLEKKWSGRIDFETRTSKGEHDQHLKNYVPSLDFVDNLTSLLFEQEHYEIEIDNAENDATL